MRWRSKIDSVGCNNERSVMAYLICVNVEPWRRQGDGAEDLEVYHFWLVWSRYKQADNEK
jgi:hypothetical protein